MKLMTIYICVHDMDASRLFYQTLLQQKPSFQNEQRWMEFSCGHRLALYNETYDEQIFAQGKEHEHFNETYQKEFLKEKETRKNNLMVLNFEVEDIDVEYQRIQNAGIAVSELRYVHIFKPYWYFTVYDPDGNELEICGERK